MTPRTAIELAAFTWSLTFAPAFVEPRSPQPLARFETSDEVMGSTFSVVVYGTDRVTLETAATAGLNEAHRVDRLLSNYRADSEWSLVNREAGTRPVTVSSELFALLSACLDYSRHSDGAFDITVGPLVRVWGFYKGEGQLPRRADVSRAKGGVGYRHVRLDPATRSVRFDRPGMELDPGGIGKGYAVDRMVEVLRRNGVDIALVSASGSSIYGMGAPPEDPRGWPITIQAPRDAGRSAAEILLKEMSMSTSGSYERFFRAGGRTYSHLIDPRTGYPTAGTASVSVIAPRTIESEAWTKPYFINGRKWTTQHARARQRIFFCEDAPSDACEWVR